MNTHDDINEAEARLVAMLSQLRIEETREQGFEDRFLADFRYRVVTDAVQTPSHVRAWEHLKMMLSNVGMARWVYGSAAAMACLSVVGYVLVDTSSDTAAMTAGVHPVKDKLKRNFDSFASTRQGLDPINVESLQWVDYDTVACIRAIPVKTQSHEQYYTTAHEQIEVQWEGVHRRKPLYSRHANWTQPMGFED